CLILQRILSVFAADATKRLDTQLVLLLALFLEGFFDEGFNRQTVTVVTRNVRRVEAHHRARFDDEVFQNLIHRGAEMDVGIRVWRAVVHDELRAAFTGAADESIEIELVPFLQTRWLALRQIGLLRESGLWQIDGLLEIERGFSRHKRKS